MSSVRFSFINILWRWHVSLFNDEKPSLRGCEGVLLSLKNVSRALDDAEQRRIFHLKQCFVWLNTDFTGNICAYTGEDRAILPILKIGGDFAHRSKMAFNCFAEEGAQRMNDCFYSLNQICIEPSRFHNKTHSGPDHNCCMDMSMNCSGQGIFSFDCKWPFP